MSDYTYPFSDLHLFVPRILLLMSLSPLPHPRFADRAPSPPLRVSLRIWSTLVEISPTLGPTLRVFVLLQ